MQRDRDRGAAHLHLAALPYSSLHVRRRGAGSMEAGPLGALPLHREPLLPCVAILCVDLSKHDKFVQVKNKAISNLLCACWQESFRTMFDVDWCLL